MSDLIAARLKALLSVSALILAVPSFSQAGTLLSADLNYAGDPGQTPYCSTPCIDSTNPSAGQVTVTVVGSNLHFDVELTTGFTFMFQSQHATSFGFGLDVTGASITGIKSSLNEITGGSWTPLSGVPVGDGIGTIWSYGLALGASQTSDDLIFDVSKAGTDLTLSDLIQTDDKHNVGLWFIADVSNANGKTGFVAANSTSTSSGGSQGATPLPATLPLLASGLGLMGFLAKRRKRKNKAAIVAA
jgi:hypothetical protein